MYEKLVSSEKDDVGDVKGFPQLREAGGFEMLQQMLTLEVNRQ